MDYPNWAPERPRSLQIYTLSEDGTPVFSNLRDRLLTDLRMEGVWRTLKRHANKPDWECSFVERVCFLSTGPRDFDTLSNREAVKKGRRIIATARDLQAMLDDIGLDYELWQFLGENVRQGHNLISNLFHGIEKLGAIHGGATDDLLDVYKETVHYFFMLIRKTTKELLLAGLEKRLEREIQHKIQQKQILTRPHLKMPAFIISCGN